MTAQVGTTSVGPGTAVTRDPRADGVDPKLRPPVVRRPIVGRARLVERLTGSTAPLTTLVAPPGSGKTTLLSQWAEAESRPVAWLGLDLLDDDPTVLLGWLAQALSTLPGSGPVPPRPSVRRLGGMLAGMGQPILLVVDDTHVIANQSSIDTLTDLLPYLPDGSVLALAGRVQPVSIGRLRVDTDVLELDAADLALDDQETLAVLVAQGAPVDVATARAVRVRTEGWAAAVSLAATAARRGAELPLDVSGDQRLVAEYLHAQVMSRLDEETVDFLHESAVLHPMTGPSLDAVLGRTGSAARLDTLAAENLLVLPVDSGRGTYRYHALLRGLLLAEAERERPDRVRELRLAASTWCREHGDPLGALEYAYAGGDLDGAVHALVGLAQPLWASGRGVTVQSWFGRLERDGVLHQHPEAALLWALLLSLDGRTADAERWLAAGLLSDCSCPLPDGSTDVRGWQALVAALQCAAGPETMLADARRAVALLAPGSVFQATATVEAAIALQLTGADEASVVVAFQDAIAVADHLGTPLVRMVTLSELALLHAGHRRWGPAKEAVDQALEIVHEVGYVGYALSAMAHAAAARLHDGTGDEAERQAAVARFDVLRPRLTAAVPYLAVQARLVVAGVHRAHGEWEAARTLVDEMRAVLTRRPALGRLGADVEALERTIGDRRGGSAGSSTLTMAELRLLPLLPTHLSFKGIGERLFLSPHTIKTQALSIYRKLGATSRDEAVRRARELGLLDD